jgi:hypothetical protein
MEGNGSSLDLTLGANLLVPPIPLEWNNAFRPERCLDRCAMRPGVSSQPSLFTRLTVVEHELLRDRNQWR